MRAAQVVERKAPYKINDTATPEPKEYDLLIKPQGRASPLTIGLDELVEAKGQGAAGVCHTDGMALQGAPGLPQGELPLTASHEPAGTVVQVGNKVKGFSKGDRVASLTFRNPCGACADCRAGQIKFCDKLEMGGITTYGSFAEYCIVDSRSSAKLPDTLSFNQAAPHTCAGASIWGAIKACTLSPGQSLAIIGLGALGHIGVQLARCLELTVIGIDARSEPLDLVRSFKHAPHLAVDGLQGPEAAFKEIKDMHRLDGVEAVIDAKGVEQAHDFALKLLVKHGLFVLVGQPPKPINIDFERANLPRHHRQGQPARFADSAPRVDRPLSLS